MSVQYDVTKENWWLSVGNFKVGDVHRSLTNKLLRDRWLVCEALENARIAGQVHRAVWAPVVVNVMKNGEPQSEDTI